jgi:hypothetical protein
MLRRVLVAASLAVVACGPSSAGSSIDEESARGANGAPPSSGSVEHDGGARGEDGRDGGDGGTAASGDCPAAEPVTAPAGQWTWNPESEMKCGNGTATGWGINVGTSKRVVILMMGGGGCFDAASCSGQSQLHRAANLDGYGKGKFDGDVVNSLGAGTLFDRNAASNPFRSDTFVFVPYCTGDFHSGSAKAPYGIEHVGFTNMGVVAKRLGAAYCKKVDRVILTGTSAGGFGAVFNYEQIADAVKVRVDLVDDSGPPMGTQSMPLQNTMRPAWGSAKNVPAGCPDCATQWSAFLPYLTKKHATSRFSLIASRHDYSICPFFGMPQPQQCEVATDALVSSLAPLPNLKTWVTDEFKHVFLGPGFLSTSLPAFITQQVNDDPGWKDVRL